MDPKLLSAAAADTARPVSTGTQAFKTALPADHPGSKPMPKRESKEQASGETTYHDDEGNGACLYAAFVPATVAPAKVTAIDTTAALKMPGVVDFIGSEDIPGMNSVAFAAPGQEELFVEIGEDKPGTSYVGHPVGVVVAKSRREAEAAAKVVAVHYQADAPGVYSIEQAIAAKSYQPSAGGGAKTKVKGDPDAGAAKIKAAGGLVLEGELLIGGQCHFAMEKNVCLAIPQENGRYELHHSCQMPDGARTFVAMTMGISEEKITILIRRSGGAFGGKATKNIPAAMAATICAKKLRQPVKLANSIEQDMLMYVHFRPGWSNRFQ